MTEVLIVPDPTTLTVGVRPHLDGDLVVQRFTDARSGITYVMAHDPMSADELATLLHTAVISPRVGAAADQARAKQADR